MMTYLFKPEQQMKFDRSAINIGNGCRDNYGFVFSSDILDWQMNRERKTKILKEKKRNEKRTDTIRTTIGK